MERGRVGEKRRGEGSSLLGGSTDVALSALRGIFEALKLCHKMLLPRLKLLLLLGSHVTVAVVPGLGLGLSLYSPW